MNFTFKRLALLAATVVSAAALLSGCSGDNGATGATGATGPQGAAADPATLAAFQTKIDAATQPESCGTCHSTAGVDHQAIFNKTKDTSTLKLTFTSVTATANADGTFHNVATFKITSNGADYTGTVASNKITGLGTQSWNMVTYNDTTKKVDLARKLDGTAFAYTLAAIGSGTYTMTSDVTTNLQTADSYVYGYVASDPIGPSVAGHVQLYDNVSNAAIKTGAWTYVSKADVKSCENCHGTPYEKHGYRDAVVGGIPDFVACKACHYDTRPGSDAAEFFGDGTYAYTADVMTDVHASHLNVFPYPQEMKNCATCHIGTKLADTLTDANFRKAVCTSCHAEVPTTNTVVAKPLSTVVPHNIPTAECNTCHAAGNIGPTFTAIHAGYNPMIYAANGDKYADKITASVDSATLTGNVLDIKLSAAGTAGTLKAVDVVPTVMVSFYGYDTKDYIVSNHTSDANGKKMEKVIGTANPLFTEVATGTPGSWEVKLDLAAYAKTPSIPAMIADGTIKRAEIAVMPTLKDANGVVIGLNAPSKTFDISGNAFTTYFTPIVDAAKCNKCHDQLGTSFHTGDRGGNVVVCRMCHVTTSGGSHLEMQSRSIDSYIHAIHSSQQFDVKNINFADTAAAAKYEEEIGFVYPMFTTMNCESCHNPGTYNVPDQSKSLPGVLSASAVNATWNRNIKTVPSYVTGPASRACGSCHRAAMINEDAAGDLATFNAHTKVNGTLIQADTGVLDAVITKIMAQFK